MLTILKVVMCPEVPDDSFATCVEECSGDSMCGNGQKCCSNGCGHVCMAPVPGMYKKINMAITRYSSKCFKKNIRKLFLFLCNFLLFLLNKY